MFFVFVVLLNFRNKYEILALFFLFNSKKNYEDGPFPSFFRPLIPKISKTRKKHVCFVCLFVCLC